MEGTRRKRSRKGKTGVSKSNNAMQNNENTLDTNTYLTYDILRIVFKHLNGKDLGSAAMVCRSWSVAANNEKWTRGPCCFLEQISDFDECSWANLIEVDLIKKIRVKPTIGFFFIHEDRPYIIKNYKDDLLPEHCEILMLYSSGIIMDDNEMDYNENVVFAFLPQISNVKIKSFSLTELPFQQKVTELKIAEYEEIISTIAHEISTSNCETSICLMLICNYVGFPIARRCATAIQNSKENEIASVWGGVVRDMHVDRICRTKNRSKKMRKQEKPRCVAVLITGTMQTWSTILDRRYNTKEKVEARLKLFKDKVELRKHSVGFMFACQARGIEMHDEPNVESTIFKKLFPKVPLVGCFGYGEFGKNTIAVEANEKNNDKKANQSKYWYNEFSTVFLILTYG